MPTGERVPLLVPDPQLQQPSDVWHFYLQPVPAEMEDRAGGGKYHFTRCAIVVAHHEFIQLGLFKAVRVVLQFDLVGLALLPVDLQEHLSVRPRPLHV